MMNILLYIGVIVIVGYLIGSLHGSLIAQKLSGTNVKENGIKNSGASNATIVLGGNMVYSWQSLILGKVL